MLLTRKSIKSESVHSVSHASKNSEPCCNSLQSLVSPLAELVNPDTSLRDFQQKVAELLRTQTGSAWVECILREGNSLKPSGRAQQFEQLPLDSENSLPGHVACLLKPVTVTNAHTCPFYQKFPRKLSPVCLLTNTLLKPNTVACVPMLDSHSKVRGVLQLFNKKTSDGSQTFYSASDLQKISELGTLLAEILRSKKKLKEERERTNDALKVIKQSVGLYSEITRHTVQEAKLSEIVNTMKAGMVVTSTLWASLVEQAKCNSGAVFVCKHDGPTLTLEHGLVPSNLTDLVDFNVLLRDATSQVAVTWCALEAGRKQQPTNVMFVPVVESNGEPRAVLVFLRTQGGFSDTEQSIFKDLASALVRHTFEQNHFGEPPEDLPVFEPDEKYNHLATVLTDSVRALMPFNDCSVYLIDYTTESFWIPNGSSCLHSISFAELAPLKLFERLHQTIACPGSQVEGLALDGRSNVLVLPVRSALHNKLLSFVKLERAESSFKSNEQWMLQALLKYYAFALETLRYSRSAIISQEVANSPSSPAVQPRLSDQAVCVPQAISSYLGFVQVILSSPQSELAKLRTLLSALGQARPIYQELCTYLSCDYATAYVVSQDLLYEIGTANQLFPSAGIARALSGQEAVWLDNDLLCTLFGRGASHGVCLPLVYYSSVIGVLIIASSTHLSENSRFLASFVACILGDAFHARPVQRTDLQLALTQQRTLNTWIHQLMVVLNHSVMQYNRCKRVVFSTLTDSLEALLTAALNLVTDCTNSTDAELIFCSDDGYEQFTVSSHFSCIMPTPEITEVMDALEADSSKQRRDGLWAFVPVVFKGSCIGYIKLANKYDLTHTQAVPFTLEDLVCAQQVADVIGKVLIDKESLKKESLGDASNSLKKLATKYEDTSLFQVARMAAKAVSQSDSAFLFKVDDLRVKLLAQDPDHILDAKQVVAYTHKLVSTAKSSQWIQSPKETGTFDRRFEVLTKTKVNSLFLLPLKSTNHNNIGMLLLVNPSPPSISQLEHLGESISCCLQSWFTQHTWTKDLSILEQILNTLASFVLIFNDDKELVYSNQPINEVLGIEFQPIKARSDFLFSANPAILKDINDVYENINLKIRKASQTIVPKHFQRQHSQENNSTGRVFNYSIMRLHDYIESKPASGVMMILEDSSALEAIKSDFQAFNDKLRNIVNPICSTTPLQACIKALETVTHSIGDLTLTTELETVIQMLKSGRSAHTRVEMVPEANSLTAEAIDSLINIYSESSPQIGQCQDVSTLMPQYCIPLEEGMLSELRNWGLNVFEIDDRSKCILTMFNDFNLLEIYMVPAQTLQNFVRELEETCSQKSNPFHNFLHCFNVMHATYMLLVSSPAGTYLSTLDLFGLLIAALCHDVDHTGRTNSFEVHSRSALALRYHDKSVLENHHAAVAFQVMSQNRANLLKQLTPEQYKAIRKLIIYSILGTDMSKHAAMMSSLTERFNELEEAPLGTRDTDVHELCRFLLHCADLSHCTKPFEVYAIWSRLVCQEFTDQYTEETRLGLPQTEFYKNLAEPKVYYSNEIGFLAFVVTPLWKCANVLLAPHIDSVINGLETNISIMKQKLAEWKEAEGESSQSKTEQ